MKLSFLFSINILRFNARKMMKCDYKLIIEFVEIKVKILEYLIRVQDSNKEI